MILTTQNCHEARLSKCLFFGFLQQNKQNKSTIAKTPQQRTNSSIFIWNFHSEKHRYIKRTCTAKLSLSIPSLNPCGLRSWCGTGSVVNHGTVTTALMRSFQLQVDWFYSYGLCLRDLAKICNEKEMEKWVTINDAVHAMYQRPVNSFMIGECICMDLKCTKRFEYNPACTATRAAKWFAKKVQNVQLPNI